MEGDNPYRSGPKPEKIVCFYDSINVHNGGEVTESCVDKANEWLKNNVGRIEILKREVANDNRGYFYRGYFRGILIWYRERE